MAVDWMQTTLTNLYDEALSQLESVIRDCPDDRWTGSVWEVRPNDRHVWPILTGMGAELPGAERLQLHSAFCNIAFHVLFFLDHYLSGGVGRPEPPPPFQAEEQKPHTLPQRVYSRRELLGYAEYCRQKLDEVLASLTDEVLARPARIGWPFGDLLIRNVLQVTEHVAQLGIFLNREAGWSDARWTPENRWFRSCPDCPMPESSG